MQIYSIWEVPFMQIYWLWDISPIHANILAMGHSIDTNILIMGHPINTSILNKDVPDLHLGILTGKPAGVRTSTHTHIRKIPIPEYQRVQVFAQGMVLSNMICIY
jgi:hypothetical protein